MRYPAYWFPLLRIYNICIIYVYTLSAIACNLSTDTTEDVTMIITVELIDTVAWLISTVSKSEMTQVVKNMKQIIIHNYNELCSWGQVVYYNRSHRITHIVRGTIIYSCQNKRREVLLYNTKVAKSQQFPVQAMTSITSIYIMMFDCNISTDDMYMEPLGHRPEGIHDI